MGKHLRIWLAVLILAAMGGFAWLLLNPLDSEPVYQGKRLRVWLQGYQPPKAQHEQAWRQADEAVRQIGTNAIPTLLAMLHRSDSAPWKQKILDLAYKQHFIKLNRVAAWRQNFWAAIAFGTLGDDAASAVPDLIKLYDHPVSYPSQRYTAYALSRIGPAAKPAIPSLLRAATTSTEEEVQAAALYALGGIHSEPERVVPVLENYLRNTSIETQREAIDALGNFGADARSALPALVELMQSPNREITNHVRSALLRIDSSAATKAGIK